MTAGGAGGRWRWSALAAARRAPAPAPPLGWGGGGRAAAQAALALVLLDLLLRRDADPRARLNDGTTMILSSFTYGNGEGVRALMRHDLTLADDVHDFGVNPFAMAALYGQARLVLQLLLTSLLIELRFAQNPTKCLLPNHTMAPCGPGNEQCGPPFLRAPQFHIRGLSCGLNDPNAPVFDQKHEIYHLSWPSKFIVPFLPLMCRVSNNCVRAFSFCTHCTSSPSCFRFLQLSIVLKQFFSCSECCEDVLSLINCLHIQLRNVTIVVQV